jgi:DNA-binding transcriptional MerR regulator
MDGLTINEAARTAGWSPRMLRYIENSGLVVPRRSPAGYRLYGPEQLQRLRTLRELLERFDVGLGDVGFARRLRQEPRLLAAVTSWLEAAAVRPAHVTEADWLHFEHDKHERLLAAAGRPVPARGEQLVAAAQ